jgi:hypothetical protein
MVGGWLVGFVAFDLRCLLTQTQHHIRVRPYRFLWRRPLRMVGVLLLGNGAVSARALGRSLGPAQGAGKTILLSRKRRNRKGGRGGARRVLVGDGARQVFFHHNSIRTSHKPHVFKLCFSIEQRGP